MGQQSRDLSPLYAFDDGINAYLKAGLGSIKLQGARLIGSKTIQGEKIVKTVLFVFAIFLATSALAQNLPPACGPANVSFNVRLNKSQSSPPEQAPGKATIVFIQDIGAQQLRIGGHVIGKFGVDGSWVGAIMNNSYFFVPLEPGEHHICVSVESELPEFVHFTAEAGKVYYFRSLYMYEGSNLLLAPADSDEAAYWIANFPLSVSKPKK